MSVYKVHIDDFSDDNYELIGIHTSIESYQLAFLINKSLRTKLKKANYKLNFKTEKYDILYAVYDYTDKQYDCNWFLIENRCRVTTEKIGLFGESEQTHHLIPEKKEVDYFLKLEGTTGADYVKNSINGINNIPLIATSYLIKVNQLKSKEFLIF